MMTPSKFSGNTDKVWKGIRGQRPSAYHGKKEEPEERETYAELTDEGIEFKSRKKKK